MSSIFWIIGTAYSLFFSFPRDLTIFFLPCLSVSLRIYSSSFILLASPLYFLYFSSGGRTFFILSWAHKKLRTERRGPGFPYSLFENNFFPIFLLHPTSYSFPILNLEYWKIFTLFFKFFSSKDWQLQTNENLKFYLFFSRKK